MASGPTSPARADAVAAGGYGAARGVPILLTHSHQLSPGVSDAVGVR